MFFVRVLTVLALLQVIFGVRCCIDDDKNEFMLTKLSL